MGSAPLGWVLLCVNMRCGCLAPAAPARPPARPPARWQLLPCPLPPQASPTPLPSALLAGLYFFITFVLAFWVISCCCILRVCIHCSRRGGGARGADAAGELGMLMLTACKPAHAARAVTRVPGLGTCALLRQPARADLPHCASDPSRLCCRRRRRCRRRRLNK